MGAQTSVFTAPWLALAPGLAITLTLTALASLGIGGPPSRLPHLVTDTHHHAHPESAPEDSHHLPLRPAPRLAAPADLAPAAGAARRAAG